MILVPGTFNICHEMKYNSAVTHQNQLKFRVPKGKTRFLVAVLKSLYKVLLDSDMYLLSYSTLINPLEPDVHHLTSQILSISIDFYPDLCTIFRSFSQSLHLYNCGTRKDIKTW